MGRILIAGLKEIFAIANGEPIVTNFTDTDYYKVPMSYFQYKNPEYRNVQATFKLLVRDKRINLKNVIPESQLREQLDECRKLVINPAERSFVGGMTMSDNKTHIIPGDFLHDLSRIRLPDYNLEVVKGDYELTFRDDWWKVTWWEIFSMEVVSELYYYNLIKKSKLSNFEIATIYSRMLTKIHDKIKLLKTEPGLTFALFDTRRRHSRYMQELVTEIMRSEIPSQCVGTSNVWLSMKHGSSNPIGTNAHELPMVKVCLAGNDVKKIRQAQYDIVKEWYDLFGPDMSIMLPDTYGTVQFLKNAPAWIAEKYKGTRPDSMDPDLVTDIMVEWWKKHGIDPKTKLVLPSDGLDAPDMVKYYRNNHHKVGVFSFGWGTLAGNDCRGTWPRQDDTAEIFRPFSMACKVVEANGVQAIKLPDNPGKRTGTDERTKFIESIFGTEGEVEKEVIV